MTDVEDLVSKHRFRSLRTFLDHFHSMDELETKSKRELTATQVRLFTQYYNLKNRADQMRLGELGLRISIFIRRGTRVEVFRDKRGRFVKFRR